MSPIITLVLGLGIFTWLASCQEAARQRSPFTIILEGDSATEHFESLRIQKTRLDSTQKLSTTDILSHILQGKQKNEESKPSATLNSKFSRNISEKINTTTNVVEIKPSHSKSDLARIMREQFDQFKKSLSENASKPIESDHHQKQIIITVPVSSTAQFTDSVIVSSEPVLATNDEGNVNNQVIIGEIVTKSERRAGEDPSGVRSGILRIDSHPIPVTFTSLPGFPSVSRPIPSSTTPNRGFSTTRTRIRGNNRNSNRGVPTRTVFQSPVSFGSFPNIAIDNTFGGQGGSVVRGAGFDRIGGLPETRFMQGTREPSTRQSTRTRGSSSRVGSNASRTSNGINSGIGHLMRLLEERLIGGIQTTAGGNTRNADTLSSNTNSRRTGRVSTTRTVSKTMPNDSPLQQFDPSIVINFLTLVALSQQQQRSGSFVAGNAEGQSTQSQRNASPRMSLIDNIDGAMQGGSDSDFGPFSDGNDPAAGVDPSTIGLPPMLRQTLYSYLLPRLSSLSALVETLPGVPGLDYPIISTVPYTNFYCSNMPWPGFYADTEARCQLWHYCDLEGRQASFLCPNGTIFNQAFFVCDWWYNFDCPSAPYLYSMNERVFDIPEVQETAPHRPLTAEILDTIFL